MIKKTFITTLGCLLINTNVYAKEKTYGAVDILKGIHYTCPRLEALVNRIRTITYDKNEEPSNRIVGQQYTMYFNELKREIIYNKYIENGIFKYSVSRFSKYEYNRRVNAYCETVFIKLSNEGLIDRGFQVK